MTLVKSQATDKWRPPFETTRRDLVDGTIDSLIHVCFVKKVYKAQKTSWNRATSKLQTTEDHHSKLLDEIWLMVLSTALLMSFTKS